MMPIISFFILIYLVMVFLVTREIVRRLLADCQQKVDAAREAFEERVLEKAQLISEKKQLEQVAVEIFTLYDVTKEIAKYLTDDEAIQVFKNKLAENFSYEECLLLDPLSPQIKEIREGQGWLFFPLRSKLAHLGYLAVRGVRDEDKEKVTILANQFGMALQRIRLYEDVEKLAMTDSLTNVYTRRYVMQRLEEEKRRADDRKVPFAFLMIDVDRFKSINDHHGHLAGDQVLREVARIIRENVREIDICGRYGGEEFCVVLPDTGIEGAYYVAERIRGAVEKTVISAYDANITVTVSIGVASFPQDGKGIAEIIDKADWAMYRAKKNGRNAVYASALPHKTT